MSRSPARRSLARRAAAVLAVVAVVAAASACAAVLGISGDYREGEGEGGADARTCDASDPLGCFRDANEPPKACDPSSCATAGGACVSGSCLLACDGGCANSVFTCPPNTDCVIACSGDGSCAAARCVGGRSCTFDCSGNTSCKFGISCESERCEFHCSAAMDSCKDGLPLACDASICIAECSGKNACNRGVNANATTYCGITCSGTPSCNTAGAQILCISPDASILCGLGKDNCKDGKPSCYAHNCSIQCLDPSSCAAGLCCDAATCDLQSATPHANVCP